MWKLFEWERLQADALLPHGEGEGGQGIQSTRNGILYDKSGIVNFVNLAKDIKLEFKDPKYLYIM